MLKGGQREGGVEEGSEHGQCWKEDRERVEKRRVVSKDNVERRTGRGWRKGKQ